MMTFLSSRAIALAALCIAAQVHSSHAKEGPGSANPAAAAEQAAVASGALSKSDAQMNCKRMAGRMQIRILELRGGGVSRGSSSAAQSLQSTVVPIFGGSTHGADAAGDTRRDLAALKAMNTILQARKCPYYDLDAELAKPASAPSPRLIRGDGKGKIKK